MTVNASRLEIVVLSEDSGQGFETVVALLKRCIHTRGNAAIQFLPSDERLAVEAANANAWKSASGRDYQKKTALVRAIANKLMQGHVVVFHYDGDCAWEDRSKASTPRQFEREVRTRVRQLAGRARDMDGLMAALIEATPYYSIEAWTYQATKVAVEICSRRYGGRDVEKFQRWSRDRAALDEVEQPKRSTCLGGRHNAELAPHVAVQELAMVGKSFEAFLKRLKGCELLSAMLSVAAITIHPDIADS